LERDLPLAVPDDPVPTTSGNIRNPDSHPLPSQIYGDVDMQDYPSTSSDRLFPAFAGLPTDPQNDYFSPKQVVPSAALPTLDTTPQMGYGGQRPLPKGQLPLPNGLTNGVVNGPQRYVSVDSSSQGFGQQGTHTRAMSEEGRPSKAAKTHAYQSPGSAQQLTVAKVPADFPIIEYPAKSGAYYMLACPHCPGRRFTGAHGLYAHLNQSDEVHAAMIADEKSFKNAIKVAGTRVVDATKAKVDAHNMVSLILDLETLY